MAVGHDGASARGRSPREEGGVRSSISISFEDVVNTSDKEENAVEAVVVALPLPVGIGGSSSPFGAASAGADGGTPFPLGLASLPLASSIRIIGRAPLLLARRRKRGETVGRKAVVESFALDRTETEAMEEARGAVEETAEEAAMGEGIGIEIDVLVESGGVAKEERGRLWKERGAGAPTVAVSSRSDSSSPSSRHPRRPSSGTGLPFFSDASST